MNVIFFHSNSGLIFLITCLFLTGCVEQSIPKLEAAIHALEDARKSGAEDYAVEIFTEAEAAYFQAQDELDQQQDRLEFFRNYKSAIDMLAKVLSRAEQAKIDAIANKEEAKANAGVALVSARQHIHNVRILLTNFIVPTTGQLESDQLVLAFQTAEILLAETEVVMTEEDFIEVMTNAHLIESLATRIQEWIISVRQLSTKREV